MAAVHDFLLGKGGGEQWFGLNAEDPVRVGSQVVSEQPARVRQLAIDHDAAFVYLTARLRGTNRDGPHRLRPGA